jgi:ribosome-associated protein
MAGTQRELTNQMLTVAVAACEDKKAEDIRILALDPAESGLADYFLICTGQSDRQNVAITDEIEIQLKRQFGAYPQSVEGRRQGEWILMDYVDFIVHVFSVEKRAYYGLERLRKSATTLSIADLNNELRNQIASRRKKPVVKAPARAAAPSKPAPRKPAKKAVKTVVKKAAKKTVKKPVKKAAPKKAARKSRKSKKRTS